MCCADSNNIRLRASLFDCIEADDRVWQRVWRKLFVRFFTCHYVRVKCAFSSIVVVRKEPVGKHRTNTNLPVMYIYIYTRQIYGYEVSCRECQAVGFFSVPDELRVHSKNTSARFDAMWYFHVSIGNHEQQNVSDNRRHKIRYGNIVQIPHWKILDLLFNQTLWPIFWSRKMERL